MTTGNDYLHGVLGRTGRHVYRIGVSASYRPGVATISGKSQRNQERPAFR